MSVLVYNDIRLPYCHTTSFRQEAVYDDMGTASSAVQGTDIIGVKFDIEVTCTIAPHHLDSLWVGDPASPLHPYPPGSDSRTVIAQRGVPGILNALRAKLLAPRRRLSFRVGGVEMIPRVVHRTPPLAVEIDPESPVAGRYAENVGTVDSLGGPRPQTLNIIQLNDGLFMLTYHIIAVYWENRADRSLLNYAKQPVLFNKWHETLSIDTNQFMRRTRRGKILLRADNADYIQVRNLIAPLSFAAVPFRCVRDSSEYTVTPDGLAMDYTIIDRETFKLPPYPAFSAEGKYTESLNRSGARKFASCSVTLKSAAYMNQIDLTVRAVNVVIAKMISRGFASTIPGATSILESFKVEVDMFENQVSVDMQAQMPIFTYPDSTEPVPIRYDSALIFTPFAEAVPPAGGTYIPPLPAPIPAVGVIGVPASARSWPVYSPTASTVLTTGGGTSMLLQAAAYWDPNLAAVPSIRHDLPGSPLPGVQPGSAGRGEAFTY